MSLHYHSGGTANLPLLGDDMRTKLIRNLKPGDKFGVRTDFPGEKHRHAVVTVSCVQETRRGFMTGKRTWEVIGDYPWWFPHCITGYHNEKIELLG